MALLSLIRLTKRNISRESPPGRWSVYASEGVTREPSIELEVLHKTQKPRLHLNYAIAILASVAVLLFKPTFLARDL